MFKICWPGTRGPLHLGALGFAHPAQPHCYATGCYFAECGPGSPDPRVDPTRGRPTLTLPLIEILSRSTILAIGSKHFQTFLQKNNCLLSYCRRMYWSDCSVPATIQTARTEDGGEHQILVSDDQHSCIVDIAIDFDSTDIFLSHSYRKT